MAVRPGSIWTMGEMLVEIMRPRPDMEHHVAGEYVGPFPSGAPAIFIDAAARLGHPAGIIGRVGEDGFGRVLVERLSRDGVDCRFVSRSPTGSTAVAFVMYRRDGSREFIFHIGNTPAARATAPSTADVAVLDPAPAFFHVMGSSLSADEGFRREILTAMGRFRDLGARISFDPNLRPELLRGKGLEEVVGPVLADCSVFLPGVDELRLVADEPDVEAAVAKLFRNPVLEAVVLKRGAAGCTVYGRNERHDLPAFPILPVDPVDTTGAGDCFGAAFLCGLLEGKDLRESGRMAVAAGTLASSALGPMEGPVTPGALAAVLRDGYHRNEREDER